MPPLHYREIKGIAKSASRWIWERFTESQFCKIQSNRAKLRWQEQQISKELLIKQFGSNKPDMPLKQIAKQFNISLSTMNRLAKELGWVKSREMSKTDSALKCQKIVELRQKQLSWREIADALSISESNAKMCFNRYHKTL